MNFSQDVLLILLLSMLANTDAENPITSNFWLWIILVLSLSNNSCGCNNGCGCNNNNCGCNNGCGCNNNSLTTTGTTLLI